MNPLILLGAVSMGLGLGLAARKKLSDRESQNPDDNRRDSRGGNGTSESDSPTQSDGARTVDETDNNRFSGNSPDGADPSESNPALVRETETERVNDDGENSNSNDSGGGSDGGDPVGDEPASESESDGEASDSGEQPERPTS